MLSCDFAAKNNLTTDTSRCYLSCFVGSKIKQKCINLMSNLMQVSAMVGNIRNMANDMNTALVRQNQTLDRINAKDASDIQRVKMANERAAALCK